MTQVREKFWLWGHDAGSHDQGYEVPGTSRITPVEAAFYMGIANLIQVRYGAQSLPPSPQYAVPFRALDQVVWSIVGAGGTTAQEEREQVLALRPHLPNMTGVMMDDFFRNEQDAATAGALSLADLRSVRQRLAEPAHPLDLWVVLYDHQLRLPVREHLALCDKMSFWTWEASNLVHLPENFAVAERLLKPGCGKVLGCYMWDYGQKKPMPVELMKQQCETGLRWLREGRIEGMIFLASCICDLGLETVEWTRQWIAEVGREVL